MISSLFMSLAKFVLISLVQGNELPQLESSATSFKHHDAHNPCGFACGLKRSWLLQLSGREGLPWWLPHTTFAAPPISKGYWNLRTTSLGLLTCLWRPCLSVPCFSNCQTLQLSPWPALQLCSYSREAEDLGSSLHPWSYSVSEL